MSKLIEIAPVPGRVAFTAPKGGKIVSGPMTVRRSAWIDRIIASGDVKEVKKPAPAPAVVPTADVAPRAAGKKS